MPVIIPDYIVTVDDLIAGAYTVLGEARAESYMGQLAVANVIVNRLNKPTYFKSKSIWEVCHARLQFSMWNNSTDKNLEITMAIPFSDKKFLVALTAMLTAISGTLPDPTFNADHYHTIVKPDYAKEWPPAWGKLNLRTVDIGAHRFYKVAK